MKPTEQEIKRTIHVRLEAILNRSKSEWFEAKLENVQAQAALDTLNKRMMEEDSLSFGFGGSQFELRVKNSQEKMDKCRYNVEYWESVRDWADEKLIGPITEEAKRN